MQPVLAQPNSAPLSNELISALLNSLRERDQPSEVVFRDQHSNDFAEVRFADGRTLIVKRGRYEWSVSRFRTSLVASELVRMRTCIVAPQPLHLPGDLDQRPVEAYWRIDLPTLQEVWPELAPSGRKQALRSWGKLLAHVHSIRLPGCGPLLEARQGKYCLERSLRADIGSRLLPAMAATWPEAVEHAEALLAAIEQFPDSRLEHRGRLLHNDLHLGNVLCKREGDEVRCVGLLDLEATQAGPPESDLANLAVHHGPLFEQPLEGEWYAQVLSGYGAPADPWLLTFFRCYHLLNMGFYSALIGHEWHASQVAEAASAEVADLRRTRRLPEAVAAAAH